MKITTIFNPFNLRSGENYSVEDQRNKAKVNKFKIICGNYLISNNDFSRSVLRLKALYQNMFKRAPFMVFRMSLTTNDMNSKGDNVNSH